MYIILPVGLQLILLALSNVHGSQPLVQPLRSKHETSVEDKTIDAPSRTWSTNCNVNETSYTNYPYFVRVYLNHPPTSRGMDFEADQSLGYIISANYVLSVGYPCANCSYIVVVGPQKSGVSNSLYKGKAIAYNKNWMDKVGPHHFNYIYLVRLDEPIEFGSEAHPVQLPKVGEEVKTGEEGIVIGKSQGVEDVIYAFNRTVLNRQDCTKHMEDILSKGSYPKDDPGSYYYDYRQALPGFFCTTIPPSTPQSICHMGTHSVFVRDQLFGIVHHITELFLNPEEEFWYEVNHDITYYRDWIKNITGV